MSIKERYLRFRAWQQHPFDYKNHSTSPVRCANCGTEFSDNFCPRCGQKAGMEAISWRTVRQGLMMIWGMDSRSLSYSLLQLLLRPGYLISDYISGKLQVSFPPVKMLLIVAIGEMLSESLFGTPFADRTQSNDFGGTAFKMFSDWSESNPGWAMLLLSSMLLLPTWLLFRYAPKHRQHTLPQGFFIQVFMSTVLTLIAILTVIIEEYWVLALMPIYYLVAYHQLFGYGWWGTLWRTVLCLILGEISLILVINFLGNLALGAPHEEWRTVVTMVIESCILVLIGYLFERRNKNKH